MVANNMSPATTVTDRATERQFLSYAVVPDRSSRRGWLCRLTDDRGVVSYTHHATKAKARSWGAELVHE